MADIVNTVLSAFLAFCDRPVYGYYLRENPFHVSPLSDQRAGAVTMWVVGSLVFLVPAIVVTFRFLQPQEPDRSGPKPHQKREMNSTQSQVQGQVSRIHRPHREVDLRGFPPASLRDCEER